MDTLLIDAGVGCQTCNVACLEAHFSHSGRGDIDDSMMSLFSAHWLNIHVMNGHDVKQHHGQLYSEVGT